MAFLPGTAFLREDHLFCLPFVSKITRNTAIDRYRKRNAQKRMDFTYGRYCWEVEKIGSAISSDIEIYLKKKELVKLFDHFFINAFRNVTGIFFIRHYWYMDPIKAIADRHACGESKIKSVFGSQQEKNFYRFIRGGWL